jgi:hypothetical protein
MRTHACVCCPAATSGLESSSYARSDSLANHMGLFLQKTNIIRDYLVSRGASGSWASVHVLGAGFRAMWQMLGAGL